MFTRPLRVWKDGGGGTNFIGGVEIFLFKNITMVSGHSWDAEVFSLKQPIWTRWTIFGALLNLGIIGVNFIFQKQDPKYKDGRIFGHKLQRKKPYEKFSSFQEGENV